MGLLGLLLGAAAAQFLGAWAYLLVKPRVSREFVAASAAGFVAGLIATVLYRAFHTYSWISGSDTNPWGLSVFLGVCVGISQGALFRGRPLRRSV